MFCSAVLPGTFVPNNEGRNNMAVSYSPNRLCRCKTKAVVVLNNDSFVHTQYYRPRVCNDTSPVLFAYLKNGHIAYFHDPLPHAEDADAMCHYCENGNEKASR